jgi:hypothetical protein
METDQSRQEFLRFQNREIRNHDLEVGTRSHTSSLCSGSTTEIIGSRIRFTAASQRHLNEAASHGRKIGAPAA